MTDEELIEIAREVAVNRLDDSELLDIVEMYPELEHYEAIRVNRMVQDAMPLILP